MPDPAHQPDPPAPPAGGARQYREGSTLPGLSGSPDRVAKLLEKVIPFVPAEDRFPTLLVGLVCIAVIAMSVGFFFRGESLHALILGIVALLVIGGFAISLRYGHGKAGKTTETRGLQTWARLVPKHPIPDDRRDDLRASLEALRDAAFMWLADRAKDEKLRPDELRANIFLPDYTRPEPGIAFTLFMPDRLRVGMDGHPDEHLTLHPGQGLTGQVFVRQEPLIAATAEAEGKHEFDAIYHLTEEQKSCLHPGLRWIVSLPLTIPDGNERKTAGILNIDGLNHQFRPNDLNELAGYLLGKVGRVADKLAQIQTVRVKISVEE